ncbi:hypothetical protein WSK_2918 [Novosphingobium sp. Rr 2-17]|nr:hypothetical protein WSK_2918 [Novosphingobium sp. Rr 2-17]
MRIDDWVNPGLVKSILTLALLISASGASSQIETELGSRIPHASPAEIPSSNLSAQDRARATIAAFSTCLVLRSRVAVERVLSLPATDMATTKALSNLATSDCLRAGKLGMAPSLLRGGLFNALYRKDFLRTPPPLYNKALNYHLDVSDPTSPSAQSYIALHEFADCVVRSNPVDSRTVVISSVASAQETAGYSRLGPSLSGCITVGQNLSFSKTVLSGIISEALYRQSARK